MRQENIFKFDELSDIAKETAIDWFREASAQDDISEYVYDNAVTMAALMGIEIAMRPTKRLDGALGLGQPVIYYSGFCSQGDGACFEGSYQYRKGSVAALKKETNDAVLINLAQRLCDIQKPFFYQLSATMKHSGYYQHSGCMIVDVSFPEGDREVLDAENEITDAMRDFADWIYGQLGTEYRYVTSDEYIINTIMVNEYEFTEDGCNH